MDLTIDTPIQYVPRVGPAMASRLTKLDIITVRDLLYHIPFRYNDFSVTSPITGVQPGETVTIIGTVSAMKHFVSKSGKRIQEATITDASGCLSVIWFNQIYLLKIIKPGDKLHLSGEISWFGNKKAMISPEYEIDRGEEGSLHTGRLVPVYPETAGVSSKWLRGRTAFLLVNLVPKIADIVPDEVRKAHSLTDIQTALRTVHFPEDKEGIDQARRRIAFDELFFLQLRAYEQKRVWQATERARPMKINRDDVTKFIQSLPFTLTGDQGKAVEEIMEDLTKSVPMNRLLVGDVGAGKTVVAAAAIFIAHRNGLGSVLLSPTQILAEQHFKTLSGILGGFGIPVQLVVGGGTKAKTTKKPSVYVGTHALLAKQKSLESLGLVIIDEQQRFGVAQRAQLLAKSQKGETPHFLTMTATPIPRTMAKTMMGSIELSVLEEMPRGRRLVKTWVVPTAKREGAYTWIREEMRKTDGQTFVICPLIEESESLESVRAVTQEVVKIRTIFPSLKVGELHGRMKATEKTRVLDAFRNNSYQILVATPVVEVGIDIPNASIMVIEAAERFGLANLHQLRGRVGRGSLQSYCLLFTEKEDEPTIDRLKSLETVFTGPALADIDLALRGPGEVFGRTQHGMPHLKIASFTDMKTLNETQEAVSALVARDPALTGFPQLREYLRKSTIQAVSKD
jgi:ATP-dependent DNA helicase RecG